MASRYTAAFRAEAVKLVLEQHLNVPQAAKQLAMPKQTLDKWVKLAQQGKLAGLDQHRVQPVDELSAEVARLKRELAESKIGVRFFKKSRRVLCQGIHAKYTFMKQQRKQYPISQMAQWLGLSRSGFYNWLQSKAAPKQAHRQLLEVKIRAAHAHRRMTYGPRRLQKELAADKVQIGLSQLRYLWRRLGLRCTQAKKFKATTNSNYNLPVKENLLGQCFEPVKPNEMWVSDISYIPTAEGWLYLAGIKDVFTCEIVGYARGSRMTKELVSAALTQALAQKRPKEGLILHSDRGSQYCSHGYQRQVALAGCEGPCHAKGTAMTMRQWKFFGAH